jgi:cellulose synthase/poly-beta-1,6-N-acetylglucosamine synthase-like glycosyltransferase
MPLQMNSFLYTLWIILSVIVGYNLVLPVLLFLIYKIAPRKKITQPTGGEPDYAIIVTAYEQTHTLKAAVTSLLKLNYSNYLIYVVADKCDISNLHFEDKRVILFRPEEPLQSNTRSHFYAIKRFKRNHEYLTIIDSDNLVDPEYLNSLNVLFHQGYEAVQGVRKAKNLDTIYACIDAIQDIYYHFYDREILFAIGSSATLAGSGMAFTTRLYRQCLEHLDITGAGFDKVLQIEILRQKHRIAFAKKAIVYDEKTSRSDQLVKQRARWFNTWFKYAGWGVRLLFAGLIRFNWNQFLFAVLFLRPPLFLIVLSSFILMLSSLFISGLLVYSWLIAFVLFFSAIFIALIHSKAESKIYKAVAGIPLFMYYQLLSLLKARKANKISVATQHYHNKTIEEIEQG